MGPWTHPYMAAFIFQEGYPLQEHHKWGVCGINKFENPRFSQQLISSKVLFFSN